MAKIANTLDIQIHSEINTGEYGLWNAYANVTTAKSRKGRGIPAEDEYAMLAVANAIAARICANLSKAAADQQFSSTVPDVTLHNYGTHAYVTMETMDGTKAEAQAAVALIDRAIKAFKLSDIGL